MKVKEILTEGVIPPHITLSLQSIVAHGGSTNIANLIILANTVELLKNYPKNDIWMRRLNSNYSAGSDTIALFKEMDDHEHVQLASWCLDVFDDIVSRDEIRCSETCPTKEFTDLIFRSQR